MATVAEWWMWFVFLASVAVMLLVDLFVFGGRKIHKVSNREALIWTMAWIGLALLFNAALWLYLNYTSGSQIANQKALEFLTGYLIEKSLSMDNIFVILLIFNYFSIPEEYQRRILLFGVLGAIVMRFILILVGVWIVSSFHWILYFFGVFLLITGIKMLFYAEQEPDLEHNILLQFMRKHLRITKALHKERFFIIQKGLLYSTPLFIVLIFVEVTDLIFAVDSIPAIFAITQDPFIVFTSNIFAVMGLRALYFLLVHMHQHFHLLKYGLAFILMFVGVKMLIMDWFKIPIFLALTVVVFTLVSCIVLSIYQSAHADKK